MDASIFAREDKKYSYLWSNKYSDANWKKLAKEVLRRVSTNGRPPSLIDFGFGTGNAMDYFVSHGFHVEGTDISSYAVQRQEARGVKVYHRSLDDLSILNDNQFNIGFCNDVLEHIPPDLVIPSLDQMVRVCSDYLFISVCPTPSNHLSAEGENLHLTVKPVQWWEDVFRGYGSTERMRFMFSRSARYYINLGQTKDGTNTPSETSPAHQPCQSP